LWRACPFSSCPASPVSTVSDAISVQAQQTDILLHERVEFGFWTIDDANTLRINNPNTGDTILMLSEFENMGLLVSLNNGLDTTRWVEFDQDGLSDDYWMINRVFFRDSEGDLMNPMKLTVPIHGGWDPLETIELSVNLGDAGPTFKYLTFITTNGVQAHSSLTVDLDYGKATIISGTSSVTVDHDLGSVPANIQLTAGDSINSEYWAENWTNTSFIITTSNNTTQDTDFFWEVR
jgi:hypothetical protein